MGDKYRVVVYRLEPGTDSVWTKEFAISGPAGSSEEALALAAGKKRKAPHQDVNAPPKLAAAHGVLIPDRSGDVRYPAVHVKLSGTDGNSYALIGTVRHAMRKANVSKLEIGTFAKECTHPDGAFGLSKANNYDHVLRTCLRWVDVS